MRMHLLCKDRLPIHPGICLGFFLPFIGTDTTHTGSECVCVVLCVMIKSWLTFHDPYCWGNLQRSLRLQVQLNNRHLWGDTQDSNDSGSVQHFFIDVLHAPWLETDTLAESFFSPVVRNENWLISHVNLQSKLPPKQSTKLIFLSHFFILSPASNPKEIRKPPSLLLWSRNTTPFFTSNSRSNSVR